MDWDRGLKRITLVLSTVGAVVGGGNGYYDAQAVLTASKDRLALHRSPALIQYEASFLLREWKEATTFEEQDVLWARWTGVRLSGTPVPVGIRDDYEGPAPEVVGVIDREEEDSRLKQLGWQTVKGQSLPLWPDEVWILQHAREIEDLERAIAENQIQLAVAPIFGAALGFVLVWAIYATTRCGAWPLLVWITQGFREDKQKDGQETTGTGPAGDS
jgi:hypothetical protein